MSLVRIVPPAALAFAILAVPGLSVRAEGVVAEKALSLDLAQAIAQGALAKCRADGYHVSITVVDRDGLVKAAMRDEGSGPHTIDTSRRKAFTAVTFKATSADWAKRVLAADPAIAGLKDTWGTIALAGGVPIKAGAEVIGAIGVSGAPGGEKDEACAKAGIDKAAASLQ
ncbi:MAG TPA: heme-binding protein [Alphaproteobacteria bacterium]|nr:heme-binding protein [Alphaproteobacteria bacterium]